MVVNNNSGLRLYTPSLPDTTKFITSFLLLLHRTIFNGRFGNFIRIVFCTHVIYFRKKKLPKPKYCSFDIQLLLKVYVIMPKRRAAAQSVQPFVFAYPTTTILLLTRPHEDKGRSFHIQEAPTRESTRNVWSFIITITHQLMSEERTWWWCSNRTHHPQKKKDTGQSCLLRLRWCRSFLVLTTWVGESTSPVDGYVVTI